MVSRLREKIKRLEAELESSNLMITELRKIVKKVECKCSAETRRTGENRCQRCVALENSGDTKCISFSSE
jgi:hypothetical protein